MLLADEAVIALARIENTEVAKAQRFAHSTLQPALDRCVKERFRKDTIELPPAESGELLREMIRVTTDELRRWANGYSSMRWLWMLRRLPPMVFQGSLPTTSGYDRALAEVIAGRSTRNTSEIRLSPQGVLRFPIEGAAVNRLLRFCSGAKFLSGLHRDYRWSGKGAGFRFEKARSPRFFVDSKLQAAVELYDRRVAGQMAPLGRMGMAVAAIDWSPRLDTLLWVGPTSVPPDVSLPPPGTDMLTANETGVFVTAKARFLGRLIAVDSFRGALADSRLEPAQIATKEVASLIHLLACAMNLIISHPAGCYSLVTTGYFIWEREPCLSGLRTMFEELPETLRDVMRAAGLESGAEVFDVLTQLSGSEWPLEPGPVVPHAGNPLCLDLVAASGRLDTLLEFPSVQGDVANARAGHFEDNVQAVIDGSAWNPPPAIRTLRRRALKLKRATITDIDAIGKRGNNLLLVSCKGLVYSKEYDAGKYVRIRNDASLVLDAVRKWRVVVDLLRKNPKGDNYDISSVENLIGIVCTSHVVFVELGEATEFVAPGIRAVACLEELRRWLSASAIEAAPPKQSGETIGQ